MSSGLGDERASVRVDIGDTIQTDGWRGCASLGEAFLPEVSPIYPRRISGGCMDTSDDELLL